MDSVSSQLVKQLLEDAISTVIIDRDGIVSFLTFTRCTQRQVPPILFEGNKEGERRRSPDIVSEMCTRLTACDTGVETEG